MYFYRNICMLPSSAVSQRVGEKRATSSTTEADPLWLVNHDGLRSLEFRKSIESAQGENPAYVI